MTIAELFAAARLDPQGPVSWGCPIDERRPGIYVVALVPGAAAACPTIDVDSLPPGERERWIHGQPIVYIGRTRRSLARRLEEFYRHKHGKKAPHRGGQALKLLTCDLWVYWATTDDPVAAEKAMIDRFRDRVRALPFANRRR